MGDVANVGTMGRRSARHDVWAGIPEVVLVLGSCGQTTPRANYGPLPREQVPLVLYFEGIRDGPGRKVTRMQPVAGLQEHNCGGNV